MSSLVESSFHAVHSFVRVCVYTFLAVSFPGTEQSRKLSDGAKNNTSVVGFSRTHQRAGLTCVFVYSPNWQEYSVLGSVWLVVFILLGLRFRVETLLSSVYFLKLHYQ